MEARQVTLRPILEDLRGSLNLRSAADVGCGVGYFSVFLQELGFEAVGFDGRSENIEEAKRRYPDIEFKLANVEEAAILQRGSFDLVLCVGLLYHLENPVRAMRNLSLVANKILLIESWATPQPQTAFYLREEAILEDQSLTTLALYPSESSLIKICYKIGFSAVYRFSHLPDHEDFQDRKGRKRLRTMLLASKSDLKVPHLLLVPEPKDFFDPWQTTAGRILSSLSRLKAWMGAR